MRFLLEKQRFWPVVATLIAAAAYASTLQVVIDGSGSPYTTDTGEIQNALPRWGLLHPSGYPLYSLAGSLLVTILRWGGVAPAAGASLYSMLWAVVAVGLLALLAQELGASGPVAALGALFSAASTSMWVDASVAEVHSLSLAFTIASLLFAVRFSRSGKKRDLFWLTLAFSQGVVHQRAVAALAPALAVLIWNQRRTVLTNLGAVLALALLAPPMYLYLAIRRWMGVTWYFGTPETLSGLWMLLRDNVFQWPNSLATLLERLRITGQLLSDDTPWPLLLAGWAGLIGLARKGRYRLAIGMTLAWIPYVPLTLIIWEGRISDAQLAAKLPAVALIGVGLAVLLESLKRWQPKLAWGVMGALGLVLVGWAWRTRPLVLAITRDPSAQTVISTASQIVPIPGSRPTALMAPWGRMYWALTYAQGYQGQLAGLQLVDHNQDFRSIVARGDRLLVLSPTFYVFPLPWWESRLGTDKLYLSVAAPGVIELSTAPIPADGVPAQTPQSLNDAISVLATALEWQAGSQLRLTVYWEATESVAQNYSVAVHLLALDPGGIPQTVLAQADSSNPVEGWYPTTRWRPGEIVRDIYALPVADGDEPVAVRVALYYVDSQGGFVNSRWLQLPVPER